MKVSVIKLNHKGGSMAGKAVVFLHGKSQAKRPESGTIWAKMGLEGGEFVPGQSMFRGTGEEFEGTSRCVWRTTLRSGKHKECSNIGRIQ